MLTQDILKEIDRGVEKQMKARIQFNDLQEINYECKDLKYDIGLIKLVEAYEILYSIYNEQIGEIFRGDVVYKHEDIFCYSIIKDDYVATK